MYLLDANNFTMIFSHKCPLHVSDIYMSIFRSSYIQVSQEECEILRKSVPYVKLYRYNPKHLYPKLKGYGVNGHRKVWNSVVSTNCTPSVTQYSSTAPARQADFFMQ